MSTRLRDIALLLFTSGLACGTALAAEPIQLFNGKDLSGWTKRGGNATYRVENGEIVGSSAPNTTNTFLCTDKEYGDFELEYDFIISDKEFNSGVQLRSHARPEGTGERVYGYQVEIDPKERAWTGGIYFEGGKLDDEATKREGKPVWIRKGSWINDLSQNEAARKAFKLGEWNHMKVIAKGKHIQTWLNGVPAADFTETDEKAFTPTGFIALQVHAVGGHTDTKEVRWKNIKLTELE
jgi:hypothetical protein